MGKGGRPAVDRAELRSELARSVLAAAEDAILDASFADLSIAQLTKLAGISRSKFYVYFQDKDDLVQAWFAEVWAEVWTTQDDWWALEPGATQADVRAALSQIVYAYRPHVTLMAGVYDQALHNSVIRAEVDQVIQDNIARLAKHIRDGQRSGLVKPGIRPAETAAWLTWMAERTLHSLDRAISPRDLERHIDGYARLVWGALYRSASEVSR